MDKNTKAAPMTYEVQQRPNLRNQLRAEALAAAAEEASKTATPTKKEG